MLPQKAIEEFKALYREKFGIELNNEEASRRANNLINLYKAVYSEPSFGQLNSFEREKD